MTQNNAENNKRVKQSLGLLIVLIVGYILLLIRSTDRPPIVIHCLFAFGIISTTLDVVSWWMRRISKRGEIPSKAWEEDKPLSVTQRGFDEVLGILYSIEVEDDYWWQALAGSKENPVKIIIAGKDSPNEACLKSARHLSQNWDTFLEDLRVFLKKEWDRDSSNRNDIQSLKITRINFLWPKNSDYAEIIFSDAPSGALWSCGFKGGIISNLSVSGK